MNQILNKHSIVNEHNILNKHNIAVRLTRETKILYLWHQVTGAVQRATCSAKLVQPTVKTSQLKFISALRGTVSVENIYVTKMTQSLMNSTT